MNQQITKVKENATAIDMLPYLATMIHGLAHEDDKNKRMILAHNALEVVKELLILEQ